MSLTSTLQSPRGVWLPLITPFFDGQIDKHAVRNLIEHYNRTPVSGYILAATTGEGHALSFDERRKLVETVQEANRQNRPILLGVSGNHTRKMVCEMAITNDWYINGYLVTAPAFIRPTQEGLFEHFWALAGNAGYPIILYNNPPRTQCNLENETVLRLATHPKIIGIKDCCGNTEQSLDLIARKPEGFSVLVGDDARFFDYVQAGADGGILASAHLVPTAYDAAFQAIRAGTPEKARPFWDSFAPDLGLLFKDCPNPGGIKYLMKEARLIRDAHVELPLTRPDATTRHKLQCCYGEATFR